MTPERPARDGERCDCGRTAVTVFITDTFGDVPWCGTEGVAPLPGSPLAAIAAGLADGETDPW